MLSSTALRHCLHTVLPIPCIAWCLTLLHLEAEGSEGGASEVAWATPQALLTHMPYGTFAMSLASTVVTSWPKAKLRLCSDLMKDSQDFR